MDFTNKKEVDKMADILLAQFTILQPCRLQMFDKLVYLLVGLLFGWLIIIFELTVAQNYIIMENISAFNQGLCLFPYYCLVPFLPNVLNLPQIYQTDIDLKPQGQQQIFMSKFMEKLQEKHNTCYVKEWTQEEDQKLIKQGLTCKNWKKFAKQFVGKSAKVCQRRYRKLIRMEKLWPKKDEKKIRYLREVENKSWIEIELIMRKSHSEYSAKQIRQRYKNHLSPQISREKWTIAEDLELWNKVSQIGKCWSEVAKQLPTRSKLQIRNRYYKFILPLYEETRREIEDSDC